MRTDPERGIDARLTRRAVIGTGPPGLVLAASVLASSASLGDEGFEKSVAEVSNIEKGLGIYDLNQFTPKL